MLKDITALILAGGKGRRFWPLTEDKMLFPFFGSPFFHYAIRDILPAKVTKIVIVANGANVRAFTSQRFPKPHVVVQQREARGMADAILTASHELAGGSLLVIIADDIPEKALYERSIDRAEESRAFGVIPAWKPTRYFPGGYLRIERGDAVRGIVEKPGEGNVPSPYVNITGHFISDADLLIQILKQTKHGDDAYERALTTLMKLKDFVMLRSDGPVTSLKYPWHVLDVLKRLLADLPTHKGKNIDLKNNVHIQGNVWIGDNVTIYENTKIIGPTYIGDGTIIGSQNIIRESHIGKNSVTGFNSDITRSYIGDSCWFHSNYIGDSVLENGVTLGAGTVLANVRLDDAEISSRVMGAKTGTQRNKLGAVIGKNVRIGVNTSIMPGVKIGTESFIGAGIVLDRDILQNKFVRVRQSHIVMNNRTPGVTGKRQEFRKAIQT